MKLFIYSIILAVVLEGCNNSVTGDNPGKKDFGLQILKCSDGCEYAVYVDNSSGGTAMVHSPACHNPIHHLYPDTTANKLLVVNENTGTVKLVTWANKPKPAKHQWDRWKRPANSYLDTTTYYNPNGLIITDSIRVLPDTAAYIPKAKPINHAK